MWDVSWIAWLQQYRTPLLDRVFILLTEMGNELFYILLIPVVYWAIDRRKGHRLAVVVLLSLWLNAVAKEWMAMPRPDPTQGILRLVAEGGPGFPSGHAQGSFTLWTWLAIEFPRPWVIVLAAVMITGISISRLYLGVHFPGDLLGGWGLGLIVVVLAALILPREESGRPSRARRLAAVLVPLLLFPLSPSRTSEQTLGFLMGLWLGDMVAMHGIAYGERAGFVHHVLRTTLGLGGFVAIAMAVRAYVPMGLPALFAYALAAVWVTVVAPLLFVKLGLASAPQALLDRARQRRIPSVASTRNPAVAPLLVTAAVVVAVEIAVARLAPPPVTPRAGSEALWATAAGPVNIAHRGGAGVAPENTLSAFGEGLRWGAHWLELDVHSTADGQAVVIHDDTVDRTTDGAGTVEQMTADDLRRLDAAYRFTPDGLTFPLRGKGVRIPTLDEVLGAHPDGRFVVEIKTPDPAFVPRVLSAIERAGASSRVVLASFSDRVLQEVRRLAPGMLTSTSRSEATRLVIMLRLGLGAFWRPPGDVVQLPEREGPLVVVTESMVRSLHRRGVPLHVWTVDDPGDMLRLAALGVDGIITDRPDLLATVLAQRAAAMDGVRSAAIGPRDAESSTR